MAKRAAAVLARTVCAPNDGLTGLSDCDLIQRYAKFDDQAAFAVLVRRHSGMVLGVCERVLHSRADAEDACQAVFLVLARKAGANRWRPSVANWLYATARRVAGNARLAAVRRSKWEGAAAVPESVSPFDAMSARDLAAALDEELDKLSPRYREPLVLCYLEGLTRDEAAARLGVAPATLKSQLERGRKKLADALTARGCTLGLALLATAAASAAKAAPAQLDSILAAAGGAPSATVAALAQGGAMNGMLSRTKLLLAIGVLVLGFGVASVPLAAGPQKPVADQVEKPKADAPAEPQKPGAKERIVTGKVVDPDGKPRQAELHLFWVRGKAEALGATSADGTFKVTVPLREPGAYLAARANGFGFAFMEPAASALADVTLQLVKDVPIRARIVDGAGKPVAGATVELYSVRTFADDSIQAFLDSLPKRTYFREHPVAPTGQLLHSADGPFRTTTDADGRFELVGIGAERLARLMVRATGREDAEVCVVTRPGLDVKPLNQATLRLQPKSGEKLTWDFNPILAAPDFTLVLDVEKPVRGRVTDARTGKPRAGVKVTMSSDNGVTRAGHRATTDADGRYELHGARKLPTYSVRVDGDHEAGYLPARAEAKDTVGNEPVVADIACQKGVVVTGTVRNKATGQPVPDVSLRANVLAGNTFAKNYPTLGEYATLKDGDGKPDGTYRLLVIPGPVLLDCVTRESGIHTAFGPPKPDPDYPKLFTKEPDGGLEYFSVSGGQGSVNGNWCKVINAKETDTEVKQDIELEPVSKKMVKVVDTDDKPVKNVHATGLTRIPWHFSVPVGDTDEIPVFDLTPNEKRLVVARLPERKLVGAAVVDEGDPAPVLKLGTGGTVNGRAVSSDGKPVAGVTVKLYFDRREVTEVYGRLPNKDPKVETGADGTFTFGELLPGYDFRFQFYVGRKAFGPDYEKVPIHRIEKHGDTLKIGDLKLEPAMTDEE